jgi:hypothetical protein
MILVAEPKRPNVFMLRDDRRSPQRLGRAGSGPGEYQRILAMGLIGDSLWVSDFGTQRITVVSRLGRGEVRTYSFAVRGTRSMSVGLPEALTSSGHAIAPAMPASEVESGVASARYPVVSLPRSGNGRWDTLGTLDARNAKHRIRHEQFRVTWPQLMSDASLWAASSNGEFVAFVERGSGAGATASGVTLKRTNGTVVYQAPLPFPLLPLTGADVDAVVNAFLTDVNGEKRPPNVPPMSAAVFRRDLYIPEVRVPVTDELVSGDGLVLLRGNDWARPTVEYALLDTNGARVGTFRVPSRQTVRAFTNRLLISVVEDPDGNTRLVSQTLELPPSPRRRQLQ